jgi:hypothetical protein
VAVSESGPQPEYGSVRAGAGTLSGLRPRDLLGNPGDRAEAVGGAFTLGRGPDGGVTTGEGLQRALTTGGELR